MRSKRRKKGRISDNLDSLLDTMANVTGILVVLLAVTQISVNDAVARLRNQLQERPELSREAFLAAEQEAQELREALAPLLPDAARNEALRRERRNELTGLRGQVATITAELAKHQDVPRGEAELKSRLAAAQEETRQLEREIEAQKRAALLASREEPAPAVGTRDLRLPDPRPPPRGADQVVYFCRYGRIFRVDGNRMLRQLWDGVNRAAPGSSRERLRASGIDRSRVLQHFQSVDVGSPQLRWHVLESGGGPGRDTRADLVRAVPLPRRAAALLAARRLLPLLRVGRQLRGVRGRPGAVGPGRLLRGLDTLRRSAAVPPVAHAGGPEYPDRLMAPATPDETAL
jgi:hypothetical protein